MRVLLNASNVNKGGGIQVANSIINDILNINYLDVKVIVSTNVLKSFNTADTKKFILYDKKIDFLSIFFGYDKKLNSVLNNFKPDFVISVFGPTYWKVSSKIKHISGYAKPHYIYEDSPYFKNISLLEKIKLLLKKIIHLNDFNKNSDLIWCETDDVKKRLKIKFPNKKIINAGNYINPILLEKNINVTFKNKFSKYKDELKILYLTAHYDHKNIRIIDKVSLNLSSKGVKHKFIVTTDNLNFKSDSVLFVGNVTLNNLESLYNSVDCCISTSLLECFSANYIESMYFRKMLFTSDLSFSRGTCKNSAIYFNPCDANDIANKLLEYFDEDKRNKCIQNSELLITDYIDSKKRLSIILNSI